jgi:hypothetical protein
LVAQRMMLGNQIAKVGVATRLVAGPGRDINCWTSSTIHVDSSQAEHNPNAGNSAVSGLQEHERLVKSRRHVGELN